MYAQTKSRQRTSEIQKLILKIHGVCITLNIRAPFRSDCSQLSLLHMFVATSHLHMSTCVTHSSLFTVELLDSFQPIYSHCLADLFTHCHTSEQSLALHCSVEKQLKEHAYYSMAWTLQGNCSMFAEGDCFSAAATAHLHKFLHTLISHRMHSLMFRFDVVLELLAPFLLCGNTNECKL
jgi:hypothetical protein